MKTLKISLIASLIATAVGTGVLLSGLGQILWHGHPQLASFFVTLVTAIAVQISWPRLTDTNFR